MYWAEELAAQDSNGELRLYFAPIAEKLMGNESKIMSVLSSIKGNAVDLGGYYHPSVEKVIKAMRPSPTFNAIIV